MMGFFLNSVLQWNTKSISINLDCLFWSWRVGPLFIIYSSWPYFIIFCLSSLGKPFYKSFKSDLCKGLLTPYFMITDFLLSLKDSMNKCCISPHEKYIC